MIAETDQAGVVGEDSDGLPPVSQPVPKPMLAFPRARVGHRIRPRNNTKTALLEIIERKRVAKQVDYRGVALAHGISPGALKSLYYKWKNGLVELGEAIEPQEVELEAQMSAIDKRRAIQQAQTLCLGALQSANRQAQTLFEKGKLLDGLALIRGSLQTMAAAEVTRVNVEKSLLKILETAQAQKAASEPRERVNVEPAVPPVQVGKRPEDRALLQQQIETALSSGKLVKEEADA